DGRNNKIAGGREKLARVGLVALGTRGDSVIYWLREAVDAEARWFEAPLAGGPVTEFMPDEEIWSTITDPASGRMIGYRKKDRNIAPIFFDPARNEISKRVLSSLGGLNARLSSWSSDFSKLIIHTSGNGDSGSWYVVDTATMKTVKIGSEHPLIPAEAVGPIRNIAYKAKDGTELDGILTLPPDRAAKNLPVMIFPHGGPSSHDIVDFDWWAQAFASRGYAVFQPNFRGSTNRNQAFRAMGNGEWGRKMQTDLSDGLAALAEKGIVDPKRACIMGASYGGYAALAGVTVQNGLYRCAISVAGVSDLKLLYNEENYMNGDSRMSRESLQQQLGDLNLLPDYSPNRLAAKADAPILLIHGTDDTVVPYSHSRKMVDALAKAGKPFEMIDLAAEDHFLSRAPTRLQMLQAAIAFAEKHNPS
ncbi:MAG TPA: prolyl oligopeptidase family serine peptidase, partial [Croceicoccus sp.]|nr:prolyl oligopeptidase family serine peptidase [Croceicoccus sp.]